MNNYLVVSTSTVCSVILRLPFLIKLEFKLETVEVGEKPLTANLGVRCNPLVNWRLFGRNKPIRTTKGIYTSDKTKQSVQTRIYTLSSVKNVVTSCESLQLIHRVTPYNNKNSSRDLKGRETRKQGTQPQHPAPCET